MDERETKEGRKEENTLVVALLLLLLFVSVAGSDEEGSFSILDKQNLREDLQTARTQSTSEGSKEAIYYKFKVIQNS